MQFCGTIGQLAGESDDFGNCELGNRTRIRKGRVEDGNSELSGSLKVDLVCANTEAADDCEVLCRVEDASSELGLGTDAKDVNVPIGIIRTGLCSRDA